jgi:hypothetical protein
MDEKKLNEAIASILKDNTPQGREALAEMIIEFVQPNHIGVNFVGMLLNTRALKAGDMLFKKLRKGIEVRTLVPGSIHLASEITLSERANYVLDGADVKVTFNEWELESGQIGSIEEIRKEMYAKLSDFYQNKVYTLLTSVWTAGNTPSNFTNVGGPITATALENAIDEINQNSGGVKAVVGTRAALTPITKFGAFWNDGNTVGTDAQWAGVNSQLEEVVQRGFLGKYYGAPLIALEQSYDNPEDYNKLILPNNRVLVIGNNVGEFITYGDVKVKQWTDMQPTPPQWFIELYQQFGLIVDRAQGIYVLQITGG